MFRRVARVLCIGLLGVGLAATAALLISYNAYLTISFPWPGNESFVSIRDGILEIGYLYEDSKAVSLGAHLGLLAALCLTWPVTSFILARHGNKRGFPVEPTDASRSEAPKVPSNETPGVNPR